MQSLWHNWIRSAGSAKLWHWHLCCASLQPPQAAHLSLFAGLEGEMLQQGGNGHFQSQESKPHPDAVPGTGPKGQVGVWVYGILVLLTEPG